MAKAKHVSTRPSDSQAGGQFGFPPGAVVTITDAEWTEASEAGEKFVGRGEAEDPVLKLTGEIEGSDAETPPVYLRAGKAKRGLHPSKDGQFLDIDEDSNATGLTKGCNADIFLESISDKKKHKSMAVPEELHDDGIGAVLIGLKFVAGAVTPKREGLEGAPRPTLVADEIIELPKAAGGGKSARKSKRAVEEEEEEEEQPRRSRRGKTSDVEKKAEEIVVAILDEPKYKKGLPVDKAFSAVYSKVRDDDDKKEIMALIEDDDWVKGDRPWKVSGKGDDAVLLPVD